MSSRFSSLFSRKSSRSTQPVETELQEYPQQRRTSGTGTVGSIKFPFGSTVYSESDSDLTVKNIGSTMPGLGSRMMNMVAQEAQRLNKSHVRTTLTALSAQNFYLKMGLHPSRGHKQKVDQQVGRVFHFDVMKSNEQRNFEGKPMGRFTQESLQDFAVRFKHAKINPVWEGRTATVRQQSAKHWRK
jgi:hypothetical protein